MELTIVEAGARFELGETEGALRTLENAPMRSLARDSWVARLRYAYADLLLKAGRRDDAIEWFHRTAGSTDTASPTRPSGSRSSRGPRVDRTTQVHPGWRGRIASPRPHLAAPTARPTGLRRGCAA